MNEMINVLLDNPNVANLIAALSGVVVASMAFLVSVIALPGTLGSPISHCIENTQNKLIFETRI